MSSLHSHSCRASLFAAAAVLLALGPEWANSAPATAPATNAAPAATNAVVTIPKSVFEDPRTNSGYIDPFCPNRIKPTVVVKTNEGPTAPVIVDPCAGLALKGITGRRLAMINNQTFEAGETAKVKTSTGVVNVTVVEIKDKSVVVKCGESQEQRELYLPQNKF